MSTSLKNIELTMQLPHVVFSTRNHFDDSSADDMQCGDLDSAQLLNLGLNDISERVDPYKLLRYDTPLKSNYRGLDKAFLTLIEQTENGHALGAIKKAINEKFAEAPLYDNSLSLEQQISRGIYRGELNKFNRTKDKFNGLGITVHDIHAQEIKLFSLYIT